MLWIQLIHQILLYQANVVLPQIFIKVIFLPYNASSYVPILILSGDCFSESIDHLACAGRKATKDGEHKDENEDGDDLGLLALLDASTLLSYSTVVSFKGCGPYW